jgi:hypothetical protein
MSRKRLPARFEPVRHRDRLQVQADGPANRQQRLAQLIEPPDLAEDGLERRFLPFGRLSDGVLGLEAHGANRIADLVRHARGDAPEGRQAVGLCQPARQVGRVRMRRPQALGEEIERRDHAVEVGLCRRRQARQLVDRVMRQRLL